LGVWVICFNKATVSAKQKGSNNTVSAAAKEKAATVNAAAKEKPAAVSAAAGGTRYRGGKTAPRGLGGC
jgi:hypothetical protein